MFILNKIKEELTMKRILGIGLLLLSILFVGCSSNDDDNKDNNESNSVTATIDGVNWKSTKINSVTLIKVTSSNAQRFDISVQDDSQLFSLACESKLTNNDAMPLKEYIFDEDRDDSDALFINTYLIDGNSYTEHFPKLGKLKITAMNSEKKTVSGTFSFRAEKVGVLQTKIVTPDVVEVTNGVFNNLPYTVITTP